GPSNKYSLSTLTHGNSRRCRLTSSRNRVNSFSRVSRSLRATSHSPSDTTRGLLISFASVSDFISFSFILFSSGLVCFFLSAKLAHHKSGQSAARRRAGGDQSRIRQANRTHRASSSISCRFA